MSRALNVYETVIARANRRDVDGKGWLHDGSDKEAIEQLRTEIQDKLNDEFDDDPNLHFTITDRIITNSTIKSKDSFSEFEADEDGNRAIYRLEVATPARSIKEAAQHIQSRIFDSPGAVTGFFLVTQSIDRTVKTIKDQNTLRRI